MIPDSMNPRQMTENILELQRQIKEAGSKLPTPGVGDTGKILKVGSEGYELSTEYSYTPPAYSETETDTGSVWIDGRKIYRKVYPFNTGTTGTVVIGSLVFTSIVKIDSYLITSGNVVFPANILLNVRAGLGSQNIACTASSNETYQNCNAWCVVEYLKEAAPTPNVVPAPANDTRSVSESIEEVTEEPVQETKTTRKRSTSSK